ncbi:hypothetical protein CRP143_gp4 [Roseobacter phage CRP-143]|nr:hypothetical protein CRP143_gp4 [Roseobacter phage CRP-143]
MSYHDDFDYDDYDYDYEREPYGLEQHWREYEVDEGDFTVMVEVRTYCIRQGTYSSRAEDPEEYYGTYESEYEIIAAETYDDELEDWVEFDVDKLPEVVHNRVQYEFEE